MFKERMISLYTIKPRLDGVKGVVAEISDVKLQ